MNSSSQQLDESDRSNGTTLKLTPDLHLKGVSYFLSEKPLFEAAVVSFDN